MKLYLFYLIASLLALRPFHANAEQKYSLPRAEFFKANTVDKPTVIAKGDVLAVRFYYSPELNKTVRVREDGKISLDLFQGIPAAGQTPDELQKQLTEMYSKEFTKPQITVDFESRSASSAYVTGEVLLPGAKELRGTMTVGMVLAMSQVVQKTASMKTVILIRREEQDKYGVYKLDASFSDGAARDVIAAPGDILFVPRKGIAKADDFMEQYVRQLLPAAPNASVYYALGSSLTTTTAATH